MADLPSLRTLSKQRLLRDLSKLLDEDRRRTAELLAYVGEVDRRRLYLAEAYPSMFAFCTQKFSMSEAIAAKRIRAGRAACRFPCILEMIARGELHLSGVHQLAKHLTEGNHQEVLGRAKHRSMREINLLIAEIAPKPDAPSRVRALPRRPAATPTPASGETQSQAWAEVRSPSVPEAPCTTHLALAAPPGVPPARLVPLAPRRYKLQVTIGQDAREALTELQALLSHQVPSADPAPIIERALALLLVQAKKQRAAMTDRPRKRSAKRSAAREGNYANAAKKPSRADSGGCPA